MKVGPLPAARAVSLAPLRATALGVSSSAGPAPYNNSAATEHRRPRGAPTPARLFLPGLARVLHFACPELRAAQSEYGLQVGPRIDDQLQVARDHLVGQVVAVLDQLRRAVRVLRVVGRVVVEGLDLDHRPLG